MKSYRKLALGIAVLATLAYAELAQWVQHIPAGSPLEAIFFKTVQMPAGPVQSRRPPRETVADLSKQIAAAPTRSDLLSLRAQEAELNLDFTTAEQDWKAYATATKNWVALADYYHRRLQPKEELAALLQADLFKRAVALAQVQALPVETTEAVYNAWIAKAPTEVEPYKELFAFLASRNQSARALEVIDRYSKAFPQDDSFPLQARAQLVAPEEALKLYEAAFRPVMSPAVVAQYFELLNRTRNLRVYLANARAATAANPNDIVPAAKLFYYYQQQGNLPQAQRALLEYRMRRAQPTPDDLLALASLFLQTNNFAEAAKNYLDLSRTQSPQAEEGFAGLISVLFAAPEQPLPIGNGDISFYKDIATMDPYPGALNGILSLLFNSTDPRWRYADQERAAVPYFHRMKAAELLLEMQKRWPASKHLADLQLALLNAYAKHGENDVVIKQGQQFLTSHADSPSRPGVYLLIADAHARRDATQQEFAVYDTMLKELAAKAGNIPLGSAGTEIPAAEPTERRPLPVRSPQYAEVLDRYINRLVSLKRVNDALALYRRELDRNPNDPGLYERLAEFLNQNKMGGQIAQIYTRAMQQFQDRSWHHKLARWYLRQKQTTAFDTLTKTIVGTFSGSELDEYFQQVVATANLDQVLYRQVNLYAHQRFPHDLVFVRNLLNAYQGRGTANPTAYLALLRQHWYHDDELRSRFFAHLSSTGRLDAELASLRSASAITLADRAATQLIAGAEIWRSHYENAAPVMQMLAMNYPAHQELNTTASSLFRSLGQTEAAARIADRLSKAEPRNVQTLALVGDIYADREDFAKARPYWNRIPEVEPGKVDGYTEAATIYWDYYLYDEALRVIDDGRAKLRNPAALAYEAGAIHENRRDYAKAISEYLKGAQADPDSASRRRLVRLASRPALRDTIEAQTRSLASTQPGFNLRVALLEEQNRRDDIAALLTSTIAASSNFELLARVEQVAERNGLPAIREQTIAREAALTTDPVERTRLRLQLARLAEERQDQRTARQYVETAYKDNPNIAGVVRSTVDYYWRTGDRKRAVDVLDEAASRSNPSFRRQFTLEAARKATDAADYARARRLLTPVLNAEPLASDIVAAMADTYGRAGDDAGLRTFYTERLKLARTPDQQAALRRGLIPVLTRMKQHAAAVDEYIAILNRFAEDEALAGEAARYARKYNVADRLTAFYTKAASDSPKDARWPMLLARTQTALENLPAAIDNYTKALAIRPDRSDLLTARATLEERLMRFEEAAASYTKLYDLAYKDPQYMVKVAEARARLGQKTQAIEALRLAFIEGKSAKADAWFEIASKLEQWNMLPEARQYVTEGRKMDADGGAVLEGRILGRLRQYTRLENEQAIDAAAIAVRDFYTPEEKVAFAAWLAKSPASDKARVALTAGLQADAVRDLNARAAADPDALQQLIQVQQQRLRHAEVAGQIETHAKSASPDQRQMLLTQAADMWRLAANPREELRVRDLLSQTATVPDPFRYGQLLLAVSPDRFIRNGAYDVGYRIANAETMLRMIAARGGNRPLWTNAYSALTGVYYNHRQPVINNAFLAVLGPRTVAEQLAAKGNRETRAVGDVWFYYGARYGEYSSSEEFLPSEVEGRPASAESYVALGDAYKGAKQLQRALDEYGHALQLDPSMPEAHNRMAEVYTLQNKPAEARQHLQQAIRLWSEMQDRRVPETFWSGLAETIERAGPALRPDIDRLLRTYIRRNATYRFEPLLLAIWKASPNAAEAAKWISELSSSAKEPAEFLAGIVSDPVVGPAERELLYAKLLDFARVDAERKAGDARSDAQWRLRDYTMRYINAMVETNQHARATAYIAALPQSTREEMRGSLVPVEIRIAAATNNLDSILRREDISTEQLRNVAIQLNSAPLLEAVYTRELDRNNLDVSNFLGLAEVKLKAGDTATALALLRRMTLVAGEPFETHAMAAELLARHKQTIEAAEFYAARVKAVPWDLDAASRLAQIRSDNTALQTVAANNLARYEARAEAAKVLAQSGGATSLGSAELDALASNAIITVSAAERPYSFHARVKAASQTTDVPTRVRLLRGAIAIRPDAHDIRQELFRTHVQANQPQQSVAIYQNDAPQPVVRDLAAAHQKLGNLDQARRYWILTRSYDPKQDIRAELASIEAELKRIEENQRRMPHVQETIDQPERVRPRV